jgi:DNA-binding response OmpR family regulator
MTVERMGEGRRVLVVEDEMLVALMIEATLLDSGAQIVGPAAGLAEALRLARDEVIHAAILDINIRDGSSYPVADVLCERGIPFAFSSGYGEWAVEQRYRDRPLLTKPYTSGELEEKVRQLLEVARH